MAKKPPPDDMHLWLTHTKDVKRKKKTDKVSESPVPRIRTDVRPHLSKRSIEKQLISAPPQTLARKEVRRVKIEAKLDLHDMTLDNAYGALERFLLHAQTKNIRNVLIITGKGALSAGQTIRSMLPYWLSETPLRNLVSYVQHPARPEDGGQGAYYVGVKRSR